MWALSHATFSLESEKPGHQPWFEPCGHCLKDGPCYTHPRAEQDSSSQFPQGHSLETVLRAPHPILPLEPKTQDLSRWDQSRTSADPLVITKPEMEVECL